MENLENKKKYEQLKKMDKKYSIISALFFIPSIFFGLIELLFLFAVLNGDQQDLPLLVLNSIIFIPLIIAFIYFVKKVPDADEIRRYCPYCYEKDFKTGQYIIEAGRSDAYSENIITIHMRVNEGVKIEEIEKTLKIEEE